METVMAPMLIKVIKVCIKSPRIQPRMRAEHP